jgi:hypothetical protein
VTDDGRARREEAEKLFADELERDFAMTMSGVSGRHLLIGVSAIAVSATLLLYAAGHLSEH